MSFDTPWPVKTFSACTIRTSVPVRCMMPLVSVLRLKNSLQGLRNPCLVFWHQDWSANLEILDAHQIRGYGNFANANWENSLMCPEGPADFEVHPRRGDRIFRQDRNQTIRLVNRFSYHVNDAVTCRNLRFREPHIKTRLFYDFTRLCCINRPKRRMYGLRGRAKHYSLWLLELMQQCPAA
jgi:hypothetical protein